VGLLGSVRGRQGLVGETRCIEKSQVRGRSRKGAWILRWGMFGSEKKTTPNLKGRAVTDLIQQRGGGGPQSNRLDKKTVSTRTT